jgi:putative FmdB family regulatory protein
MPLIEYHCDTCDAQVELLVRRYDEKVQCPTCGQADLTRLISVPAAPAMSDRSLPMTQSSPAANSEGCGLPRCCGGQCFP